MPKPEYEHSNEEPIFILNITGSPARRLEKLMKAANYNGEPAAFILKALDVFETAVKPGAGGKMIVENNDEGKRYRFNIKNKK